MSTQLLLATPQKNLSPSSNLKSVPKRGQRLLLYVAGGVVMFLGFLTLLIVLGKETTKTAAATESPVPASRAEVNVPLPVKVNPDETQIAAKVSQLEVKVDRILVTAHESQKAVTDASQAIAKAAEHIAQASNRLAAASDTMATMVTDLKTLREQPAPVPTPASVPTVNTKASTVAPVPPMPKGPDPAPVTVASEVAPPPPVVQTVYWTVYVPVYEPCYVRRRLCFFR